MLYWQHYKPTPARSDRAGKRAFFRQLGEALTDPRIWALLAIREDYLGALDPYLRPVPTRLSNTYRLDFLGEAAALQAVQRPPQDTHEVSFDPQTAQRLVDDLRRTRVQQPDGTVEERLGAHIEPLQLQVVCYRLWQNLAPDAARITQDDVDAMGDVDRALEAYYAERVAAIAEATGIRERSIREWVDRHLITEQGLRGQVLMGAQTTGGLDNAAIARLQSWHLVRAEPRGGRTWFELTHDRLVEPVRRNNAAWREGQSEPAPTPGCPMGGAEASRRLTFERRRAGGGRSVGCRPRRRNCGNRAGLFARVP